jgi:hypothetical protein
MLYLLIGLITVVVLFGGGRRLFSEAGISNVAVAVLLATVLVGALLPTVQIGNVKLAVAGFLLLVYAFFWMFLSSKFFSVIYVFYVSAFLGIAEYYLFTTLFGGLYAEATRPYVLILALTIAVLSIHAQNALGIGLLSSLVADVLWAANGGGVFFSANGVTNALIASVVAAIAVSVVVGVVEKIKFPKKELMIEAAKELSNLDE